MTEKGEAARDGAKLQKNSGRGQYQKGDATYGVFCIDYKEYSESFSVSRKVWAKCNSDAFRSQKEPALKLVLGSGNDNTKTRLWVISDEMFHEMYDAWEAANES